MEKEGGKEREKEGGEERERKRGREIKEGDKGGRGGYHE